MLMPTTNAPKKKSQNQTRNQRQQNHTHTWPPVNAQNMESRTKPELWFAAKAQYLYDQSSHLEAKLTCTTAIGRQAGNRGDSSFCGQGRGWTGLCTGREGLFISEGSKENEWMNEWKKLPAKWPENAFWTSLLYTVVCRYLFDFC